MVDLSVHHKGRLRYFGFIAVGLIVSCSNKSNNPKSCLERAAYHVASIYPEPADLGAALAIICPRGAP